MGKEEREEVVAKDGIAVVSIRLYREAPWVG